MFCLMEHNFHSSPAPSEPNPPSFMTPPSLSSGLTDLLESLQPFQVGLPSEDTHCPSRSKPNLGFGLDDSNGSVVSSHSTNRILNYRGFSGTGMFSTSRTPHNSVRNRSNVMPLSKQKIFLSTPTPDKSTDIFRSPNIYDLSQSDLNVARLSAERHYFWSSIINEELSSARSFHTCTKVQPSVNYGHSESSTPHPVSNAKDRISLLNNYGEDCGFYKTNCAFKQTHDKHSPHSKPSKFEIEIWHEEYLSRLNTANTTNKTQITIDNDQYSWRLDSISWTADQTPKRFGTMPKTYFLETDVKQFIQNDCKKNNETSRLDFEFFSSESHHQHEVIKTDIIQHMSENLLMVDLRVSESHQFGHQSTQAPPVPNNNKWITETEENDNGSKSNS